LISESEHGLATRFLRGYSIPDLFLNQHLKVRFKFVAEIDLAG
jgi:hypothetical protein